MPPFSPVLKAEYSEAAENTSCLGPYQIFKFPNGKCIFPPVSFLTSPLSFCGFGGVYRIRLLIFQALPLVQYIEYIEENS
jgi:hypothetical protein